MHTITTHRHDNSPNAGSFLGLAYNPIPDGNFASDGLVMTSSTGTMANYVNAAQL